MRTSCRTRARALFRAKWSIKGAVDQHFHLKTHHPNTTKRQKEMPRVITPTQKRMEAALPALLAIPHNYAAQVARQVAAVHLAAKRLLALQKAIEREARGAAGAEYKEWHDVGYNMHGSLHEQTGRGDLPSGVGLVDMVDTAREIMDYAGRVAAEREPLPLPSE